MRYRLHVRPQALAELSDALIYYREKSFVTGQKFSEAVAATFGFMREFPWASDKVGESIRRCNISRFPYTLLYTVE